MTDYLLEELKTRRPTLIDPLDHRNFKEARGKLEALADMVVPETVILLVGPSNVGKSTLLAYHVAHLQRNVWVNDDPAHRPILGVSASTTREGRTAPKYVLHMLLEAAGHVLLQQPNPGVQVKSYRPTMTMDETWSLRALKNALHVLRVRNIIVDDAQYLVRAKDDGFKASLLETFKSLVTPQTTLILAGGYELAKVALGFRSHFAARTVVVHLARYTDSQEDRIEWRRIMAALSESKRIRLARPDLLTSISDELRNECHGVVGLVEKMLIEAHSIASVRGQPISAEILDECRPTTTRWDTIRADIEMGEALLGSRTNFGGTTETLAAPQAAPKRKPGRAFQRTLRRTQEGI